MKRKPCTIYASAVEVICPHCGGSQPSPRNGSFMWEKQDFEKQKLNGSKVDCADCDEPIYILNQSKANFQ